MTEKKEQKTRRRLLASAAALVTAAGLVTGRTFSSAQDLLHGQEDAAPPPAVEDTLLPDDGDDGLPDDETDGRGRRRSLTAVLRERILRLPVALRLTAVLPLWLLGQFVLGWADILWGAASPLLYRFGGFALLLLVLFVAFLLAAKAAFPNLPLKKILNRKSFAVLLLGAAVLGAADLAFRLAFPEADTARRLVSAAGTLVTLGIAVLPLVRKERRERQEKGEMGPETEPAPLTFIDSAGEFTLRTGRQ